jgi:hypothetical protein
MLAAVFKIPRLLGICQYGETKAESNQYKTWRKRSWSQF